MRAFGEAADDFADAPTGGAGLLFMASMASLEGRFEFTRATWANNPNVVTEGVGIIRQSAGAPVKAGDGQSGDEAGFAFGRFVTMTGGECFFAPSRDSDRRTHAPSDVRPRSAARRGVGAEAIGHAPV